MHQQPRGRVSSPASSPQTNPTRTNNPREGAPPAGRPRAGSEMSGREGLSPTGESPGFGPSSDSIKKLDQIVQNFYAKAAALILEARMKLNPVFNVRGSGNKKINKWFQMETEEFDDFRKELQHWRTCGSFENRPKPMIVEIYLDTSSLSSSQSLVIVDDNGKRWDVMEALNSSDSSSDGSSSTGIASSSKTKTTEVILERWRVELKGLPVDTPDDFGPTLPTIYKKSIVFFRSLFAAARILPAWKCYREASKKTGHPALELRCRILDQEPASRGLDRLRHPLYDGRSDVVTDYVFGDLEIPVGRFTASVSYRNDCNFRVDDTESLLSSRFMGVDEAFFKPSVAQRVEGSRRESFGEVGSLPSHHYAKNLGEVQQTYGSLSTFHGQGPLGTSPISALKAIRPVGSDTSSPPGSKPSSPEPDAPHSLPITGYQSGTRPAAIRGFESTARRLSVSFQPFKAGSLSGSPVQRTQDEPPGSPHSVTRPGLAALTQARNRNSLTVGMPASLRGGPGPGPGPASIDTSGAASPRPSGSGKYSHSFSHRKGRLSFGGASKADDEQGSSGRQSLASSVAQPGSGLLAEQGAGGSSGSFQTDDGDISAFLKALDNKKTLKSFEPTKRGESATNRTVAQLSKFHLMRESNNALTESMASSVQMQRSSSSSSRQLTSVPGMVQPASMSASSSPGKPLSPHTPHTPAIPSRLSENSIIDYNAAQAATRADSRPSGTPEIVAPSLSREPTITQDGTTPMDIPLSPRLGSYGRRASSVAQQGRTAEEEDVDNDPAFSTQRRLSLGSEERDPPTISMLLGRRMEADSAAQEEAAGLQPAAEIRAGTEMMRPSSLQDRALYLSPGPSTSPYGRRRYVPMALGARGQTPPQSSRGSLMARYARTGGENDGADEEPLVFNMSEVDARSRRSLEEGSGGANADTNTGAGSASGNDRGGFEPRGTTRRGW